MAFQRLSLADVKRLASLPSQSSPVPADLYKIKCTNEKKVPADGEVTGKDNVRADVWFNTGPLSRDTIQRIRGLKVFAETHDQGFCDNPDAGNWTWLELAYVLVSKDGRSQAGQDISFSISPVIQHVVERKPLDLAPVAQTVSRIELMNDAIMKVNQITDAAFHPQLPTDLHRADSVIGAESVSQPLLHVLALDGGGGRGLSSLLILQDVMNKISPGKKPCEVFDMIGGTSTGGIIAIMLGRLQMSVEDCIKKYKEINETLFNIWDPIKAKNFALTGERYSAATLEEVIKKVVKEQLQGNENAKLLEEEDPKCKVFVLATNEKAPNNRQPVFLRSYKNPNKMSVLPEIDIWQAARATSAAPTYFEPITVGTYTLIDGGLQANNPLRWLRNEVLAVYGATRETSCFLSIGTGIPANEALPKPGLTNIFDVSNALSGIATNTEIVKLLFSTLINAYAPKATEPKYWRLNVSTYIKDKDNYEDPGKLDDLKALKKFEIKTRDYIAKESQTIQNCANALKKTS